MSGDTATGLNGWLPGSGAWRPVWRAPGARPFAAWRWLMLLVGLCVGIGVLAGINPKYALLATGALVIVTVMIADLTVGLCAFVFFASVEVLPTNSSLSYTKLVGLLLAISWLALVATNRARSGNLAQRHPVLVWALILFTAWAALSVVWAEQSGAAVTSVYRYALNFILFLIIPAAVRNARHVKLVAGMFILGGVLNAVYGLLHPASASDADRLAGTVGEPNQLAAVLVAALALAVGMFVISRRASLVRLVAGIAGALCLLGMFLTLSRAGLVAFGVVLIAAVLAAGRWRGRAAALVIVFALGTVIYFSAFASTAARQRVTTINGGTGREDIWTVGWRMVQAHPITGIGVGNFQNTSIHYLLQPGALTRSDFIVDTPKVAHNIYLQELAELGVVGLVLFLTIVGGSLASGLAASRRFARNGDRQLEVLSRAVVLGALGILVADFFASEMYSKQLWLLLGLGPALLAIAERNARARVPPAGALEAGPPGAAAVGTAHGPARPPLDPPSALA